MSLLHPGFLVLALLVPAIWFLPRPARDRRHAAIRSAVLLLLVLALARPALVSGGGEEVHLFVLDVSASVAAAERARARAAVDTMRADLGNAILVEAEGSSLSAALAAAERAIPAGARGSVTLLSDGLATDRRWGPVMQRLCARGIPLHTVRHEPAPAGPRPVGLRSLGELRVGHTARIAVDMVGAGRVRLVGPEGELATGDGPLLEFEPSEAGFLPLRVEVAGCALTRTFAVQDPLEVLYLGQRVAGGARRISELVGLGFRIDTRGDDDFAARDLVLLDDRPADAFPEASQARLKDAVTNLGVGLLAAGGTASFGPGGYHQSPLAAVLPVDFVQKEEKRDPSTTLVVIIDTSGSMSGARVQLAKEVARLAVRRLLPHDKVGIVEFYGAKRWAAPIQPASNAIEIQRALNRLNAGGGTVIMPAIEEAYYGLQNVQTRYKHVLVLTDAGVESGAFEPLLRKMAEKGINVSTVLVGARAHSEFLVSLARWGKGRFYSVPNRFNLPEVILKQPTTARLPSYRRGRHAVRARGGPGWLGGTDTASIPALSGYVESRARPGAEVLIETRQGRHPVLASWRFGLGRVTALMTEPTGPGTEPWKDWEGFGRMLARVMARTARHDREPFEFTLRRDDDELTLTARARRPGAGRPAAVLLGEERTALSFRRRARGLFTATFLHPPQQEARILAGATRLVSSAAEDVAPELQVDPDAALDLEHASRATGGTIAEGAFSPRAGGGRAPVTFTALWPWMALLALLGYLADLVYRRWPR